MRKPIDLTDEQKEIAITMAEEGFTVKQIREAIFIEPSHWRNYLERHPLFKTRFAQARQEGLEELADSLQNITDEIFDVQKAKLKSDNLRWILSKRKPLVYGDRLDVNVNQTIDITGALEEARKRAIKSTTDIETESSIIPDTYDDRTTDS